MKLNPTKLTAVTGAVVALCGATAHGQSADALLDKLVDKGILTVKEANDLKKESDAGFRKAYQAKSGMPEWVTSFKLNGDFRGRFEMFEAPNDAFADRTRYRYRLRFGGVATIKDNFEVGLRLTSSESTAFGGDPISGNTTLQDNGSKKFIFVDLAYGKWTFLNTKEVTSGVTIGKMENPFVFSDMIFDHDYTPEGAAYTMTYRMNDAHALKFNGGTFVLDELGNGHEDPWLYGGQVRWDAAWSKPLATTIGVAALNLVDSQSLTNGAVPNQNRGNSRDPGTGELSHHFNPVVLDAGITYTLEEFPGYNGAFPIRAAGDYINNLATTEQETGWSAGLTLGKAGKRRTWELGYRYKYLGGDCWYEEFTDSDFGAYYGGTFPNSATPVNSYGAGTNVRGHVIKGSYSPYDCLTLTATCFAARLISEIPSGSDSRMLRVQVDAVWKF